MSTAPSPVAGAAGGALSTLGFIAIHDLWILDIWNIAGPMVSAGVACGWALTWSYRSTLGRHSTRRWVRYVGMAVLILAVLGGASFLALTPQYSLVEASNMDDALAVLLPPATPLMAVAVLFGTAAVWLSFGRRQRALGPVLVAQALLVFFVGHNLAILGLIEFSADAVRAYAEFVGLTVMLAAGYLAGAWAVELVLRRVRHLVSG